MTRLLQLADSAIPIGSLSHSFGLRRAAPRIPILRAIHFVKSG